MIHPKILTLKNRGFTLIETLVGSIVFALVAVAAYQAFAGLMSAVLSSRAKVAATSIATEKFEIIRNLPYVDVGISGGIPSGKIARNQTVTRDGYIFHIQTTIRNYDDPFDGTITGSPSDTSPSDYRLVHLDINCSNCKHFSPLQFTTLVAPYALETASNNGALFIQVFDALGSPVQGASVHIENNNVVPAISIDETTDNGGWIKIVDAPTGVNVYNITATKTGYTADQTYPLGGVAGANPLNPDSTVVIQQVTQTSLSIDRASTLSVSSLDNACLALPDIDFSITGTKKIGLPNTLKYPTQNFSTDISGSKTITNVEWDDYNIALNEATYDLVGVSSFPTTSISPNENKSINITTTPHLDKALMVSVQDNNGAPIDGATVELQRVGFVETKNTNSGACPTPGQVFWNGLLDGTYTLTVSKSGYQDSIASFPLSSAWQHRNLILLP